MDHVVRVAAFRQQLVAARLAGVALAFSTFGTPDGCDALLAALRARPGAVSVARAWRLFLEHRARATPSRGVARAGARRCWRSGRALRRGRAQL